MAKDEITNTIMEERLLIGKQMAKKVFGELKMSDYEFADISCRIAQSLFIEKNKAFRSDRIRRD